MYRLIPLRQLRRTAGVLFDEIVPSDIPPIQGIDRVIHKANGISPGQIILTYMILIQTQENTK